MYLLIFLSTSIIYIFQAACALITFLYDDDFVSPFSIIRIESKFSHFSSRLDQHFYYWKIRKKFFQLYISFLVMTCTFWELLRKLWVTCVKFCHIWTEKFQVIWSFLVPWLTLNTPFFEDTQWSLWIVGISHSQKASSNLIYTEEYHINILY